MLLCFLLLIPFQFEATAADPMWQKIEQNLVNSVPKPQFGDEWVVLALARGGYQNPSYYANYIANVTTTIQEKKGILHQLKYTEYSRTILALNAVGADPANIGGYNLYNYLSDLQKVSIQGVNGPIFALIAIDSKAYPFHVTHNSREQLILAILKNQLTSGSFTLDDKTNNIDVTAMALQSLAPYKERADVKVAIDKALRYLQTNITQITSSESYAQVIVALTALQIDMEKDSRFKNIVPAFLTFYDATTGGFKHLKTDKQTNAMATEQGAYAYVALQRYRNREPSLYMMTNNTNTIMFTDTVGHWVEEFAIAAQQQGLMNGYSDSTFRPSQTLTRAQAVSILVRALQLPAPKQQAVYKDIQHYATATQTMIQQAYEARLIQKNNGIFNPNHKITRAQLALMMSRAYTYQTGQAVQTTPQTFQDISNFHMDTQQAIQFLADKHIVGAAKHFNPSQSTTRAHAAKMFVQFTEVVK